MHTILVTGAAGFIGYHMARRCLEVGHRVIGIDNVNTYYDPRIKEDRLRLLHAWDRFEFHRMSLEDRDAISQLFRSHSFDRVVHLAAQAGVRYSLSNPFAYTQSNIEGTLTILEGCRHHQVPHLMYASSSSVYGLNTQQPFCTSDPVDHPVSLYAATKKANELMAHCYSHLYQLPTTGLRFFTVYGPWGRPDMALFKFTQGIFSGEPIEVYNGGRMKRDFTYVDDIVSAMMLLLDRIPTPDTNWDAGNPDPATSSAPYRVYNIGNHQPTELSTFIQVLERTIGKPAIWKSMPMQPGDVLETFADVSALHREIGYSPTTSIEEGIAHFVAWYRDYFQVA
ncbi:MAG: NAD-dependent epimerase [Pirellula sp.]|jgi:UDP-glucuronate 4-epimerase|nr:NAD-dependent epimerase [Pirellula sp.]